MASARLGICATVAAVAVCNLAVEPAHARFSLWPQFGPIFYYHGPSRPRQQSRDKSPASKQKTAVAEKNPLQIIVSIADQRISVYDGNTLVAQSSVSTGVPDHPTPSGVFSVLGKEIWHRSNLYSDAPMPYMQRITWSGIALHAGDLPGYPASHGCIRLEKSFAIRLWHLTKRGTRVIIVPSDVRPVEIASAHLPVARPKAPPVPQQTASMMAEAALTDTATGGALPAPTESPQQTATEVPVVTAAKPAPISIFISRKANKVFVRQAYKPLFEAPVTIENPEEPLGTHVFTLAGPRDEGSDARWTVVSVPQGSARVPPVSHKRQKPATREMAVVASAPAASPEKADAALGRVTMPPEAAERIAELLAAGSSLILSDEAMSRETGRNTDFIVETK